MIDEKRIKRFIEGAKEAFKEVDDPTFTFPMNILSAYELATSIDELLKEQEPIKPKSKVRHRENGQIQHWCGNCMAMLHGKPKYCSNCGRQVKWG